MAEPSDLTPIEWLGRLGRQIVDRRPVIDHWRDYYEGNQDLPQGPSQHREAFQEFQCSARTNLCLLCAESMVHRTQIIGFKGQNKSDSEVIWKLWQAAKMDARQFGLWRKSYSRSGAYATVSVDPRRPRTPRVTIEGPENVIVETDPAEPSRRIAALRLWHDDIARRWYATLWLPGDAPDKPGLRYHWQTRNNVRHSDVQYLDRPAQSPLSWSDTTWELRGEAQRTLPNVPVVPFLNADEGETPRAEFDVGIDIQNRLNLTVLNRLTSERYAAFRQRGLLNFEPEVDPVTGATLNPFPPGVHQLWTVPPPEAGDPPPQMFDFQQTSTSDILRGVEADMRAFAAVTITPVYYLPGDLVNIGADSIAALDAGHTSKIRQKHVVFGEGAEELLQLMADVAEVSVDLTQSEVEWMKPETFNPSAMGDYAVKLFGVGIPAPMIAEEIGWSPQRVAELRTEMAAKAFQDALAAAAAAPQQSSNGTQQKPAAKQQGSKPVASGGTPATPPAKPKPVPAKP